MHDSYYYQKYIKYKTKYIEGKLFYINFENNIMEGGAKYNFFFIHATKSFTSLLSILNQDYVYPGKYVDKKHRFMSGPETESEYIYMSMYFKDINNMKNLYAISLIFDQKLVYDHNLIFHEGWYGGNPIYLFKNDKKYIINKKIKKIHDFLENPISLPKEIKNFSGMLDHQVLASEPISLKDHLIGIAFNLHDPKPYKKELKKIENKLKEKGYNVPIFYTSKPENININ